MQQSLESLSRGRDIQGRSRSIDRSREGERGAFPDLEKYVGRVRTVPTYVRVYRVVVLVHTHSQQPSFLRAGWSNYYSTNKLRAKMSSESSFLVSNIVVVCIGVQIRIIGS